MGPFSVAPAQVEGLSGATFAHVVGRLLAAELAANRLRGESLEQTYKENVGDGGVDARLSAKFGTTWIPDGESAWQFKAGDLPPAKCRTELEGAHFAREILEAGGRYVLALGASLTPKKLKARRKELIKTAEDLGFSDAESRVTVLAADQLALWLEQFPALAVDPILRGMGHAGQTFERWSNSQHHQSEYVPDDDRIKAIEDLRTLLSGTERRAVHVDGVSGLGKTRLVMEALRGQSFETLVLYAPAADQFQVSSLDYLESQRRTSIVVIDECARSDHNIYAGVLGAQSEIRLVTIGQPGGTAPRSPMIGFPGLNEQAMTELLRKNTPGVSAEAIRVIAQLSAGNVDYALKAASLLVERGYTSAGSLVSAEEVRGFLAAELPDGALFLAACVLALFDRVGFDGEVASELNAVAEAFGIPVIDLRAAAAELERRGRIVRQGRFRSVGPHPVAIYLARAGWQEFGERIVNTASVTLPDDLVLRLFHRASEIGEVPGATTATELALAPGGPLHALEDLDEGRRGSKLLVHFAVLAPEPVTDHLIELLEQASEDELRERLAIRRTLVWTLEKLAWHTDNFRRAADGLLRLALAENERFRNNATGTWVDLFGAVLPGTAAMPEQRIEYLREKSLSMDQRVRALVVQAAKHGLDPYGSILASGEVQGGVIVEPRGMPHTYGDVWRYQGDAIELLRSLADDTDAEVAAGAVDALVGAIHAALDVAQLRQRLGAAVGSLPSMQLRQVRKEVVSLRGLFGRVDDVEERRVALDEFEALLPPVSPADELWSVARMSPWDWEPGEAAQEIVRAAQAASPDDPAAALVGLLDEEVPTAFEIGQALYRVADPREGVIERLVAALGTTNASALLGFLRSAEEDEVGSFDRFVDDASLTPSELLRLTVGGPDSDRALERLDELIPQLSVREGAGSLFAFGKRLSFEQIGAFVRYWLSAIDDQVDYNALVDFLALRLRFGGHAQDLTELKDLIWEVLPQRARFPKLASQGWHWAQLASAMVDDRPAQLVSLFADLVDDDALNTYERSEDAKVMRAAVAASGETSWKQLMDRIHHGSWRLTFAGGDWLAGVVPIDVARGWVSGNVELARTLASVATVGEGSLSDAARYLLVEFEGDQQISSSFFSGFVSGSWTGHESDRVARQIDQVKLWLQRSEPDPVQKWLRGLVRSLERQREAALQREAEERW